MKKLLFIAIITMCATVANAQLYLGGSFGIKSQNIKYQGNSGTSSTYSIAPEFGYNINKTWAVGIAFGAQYIVEGSGGSDYTSLAVQPYVRATFARTGILRFFVEGRFSYENVHNDTYDVSTDGWGLMLCPGMFVDVSKKVSLSVRTALLQYAEAGSGSNKTKVFNINVNSDIELGVFYNF